MRRVGEQHIESRTGERRCRQLPLRERPLDVAREFRREPSVQIGSAVHGGDACARASRVCSEAQGSTSELSSRARCLAHRISTEFSADFSADFCADFSADSAASLCGDSLCADFSADFLCGDVFADCADLSADSLFGDFFAESLCFERS